MNTKKRNKNKSSKPPTPNPPQKEDLSVDTEITEKNVEEKSEIIIKSDERVPEIVSEIITPIETKVCEDETPKKPKRSRGKKKKGDKGLESNEISRERSAEPSTESQNTGSNVNVDKPTDETTAKTPEIPVTPASRKKKNKNKKQAEQQSEKNDEQKLNIVPISKEEFMPDLKIINLVPVATDGPEDGKSKKKNKKKKRLDSEKSDKVEEVLSCTAAFQKLLEPKDDNKDTKKDETDDTKMPIPQDVPEQQEQTIENMEVKKGLCTLDDVLDNPNENFKEEGKSKKKNKKEKKFPPKPEIEITDQPKFEACAQNLDIVDTVDNPEEKLEVCALKGDIFFDKEISPKLENRLVTSEITEEKYIELPDTNLPIDIDVQQIETSKITETKPIEEIKSTIEPPLMQMEKNSKPKAKIAKPVDKKLKGMAANQCVEDVSHSIEVMQKNEEDIATKTVEPKIATEPNIEGNELQKHTEQILDLAKDETKIQAETKLEAEVSKSESKQPTEYMQIPQEKRKKRKKSPKPSKVMHSLLDVKSEFDDIIPKEHMVEETREKAIESEETISEIKSEICEAPITTVPVEIVLTESLSHAQSLLMTSKDDMKQIEEQKLVENVLESILAAASPPIGDNEQKIEDDKLFEISEPKQEPIKKESTPIALSCIKEIPSQNKPEDSTDISDIPMEIKDSQIETEVSKFEQMPLPQSGSGKKRKKSPKPKKIDFTSEKPEPKDVQKPAAIEKSSGDNVQERKESLDLPPLEDIENSSVKVEVSGDLICDIVPEVHHPRATSLDNNNNMVTREVTLVEEGKLNIPIVIPDTPLIQGSGESPTPEISSTGITITEVDIKSNPAEKTDLKSKVIEVNKDMEELRQSIEKSLAELTAMEKSEEQTEKKFEQAQAKIEAIRNLAVKQETSLSKEETVTKEDDPNMILKSETEVSQTIEQQTTASKFEEQKFIEELDQFKSEQIQADLKTIDTNIESLPLSITEETIQVKEQKSVENVPVNIPTPPPPPRKDNKGKNKRRKGKQEVGHIASTQSTSESTTIATSSETKESKAGDSKKEEKSEQKPDSKEEKGKQQLMSFKDDTTKAQDMELVDLVSREFEPIENFEDALTSNDTTEDVNKTFEIIANEVNYCTVQNNPDINIEAPTEDEEKKDEDEKISPVSQPKNLLGHPDIPARLNRTDYKKEKNKTPNTKQAKVKIKDSVPIEVNKQSKESQTENKRRFLKDKTVIETVSSVINDDEEYIYKYSFRRVFLPSSCHTCKKNLKFGRSPCSFCNLIFYCGPKHRDEDYPQHQALCFAVSTIAHLKEQKYIYGDAQGITGQDYRLLRMQMIVSCEKVLKRRLVPWEQEALLYPRICADEDCREWRQGKLEDCEGCEQFLTGGAYNNAEKSIQQKQLIEKFAGSEDSIYTSVGRAVVPISYCADNPNHLSKTHQRWCKSYSLYQKLVTYQQTSGRLEPKLPGKVMTEDYQIPDKMNEILATMYEERIDMNDIQYAALTQIATAPLTAAYCHQLYATKIGSASEVTKKSTFTIHVVGAELQFEADALHKWEVFFLHLKPDVKDLRLVLIGSELNPSNLPLDLLSKIKLCDGCRQNNRRVTFDFQDKKTYYEYWSSDFTIPDLVCAFNPSIQRSSIYNGKDTWPSTIKCIAKQKVPFVITSYTLEELRRDLAKVEQCSDAEISMVSEPNYNPFSSVRPDRNFISDDEMPLLFKNFCYSVVCGSV